MPTSSGEYIGDQATVLPDNTQALLHFSNVFAQRAQQQQEQARANQQADEARRIALQKYLGDKLSSKNFETNSTYQGIVNSGLSDISAQAEGMMGKVPPAQIYAYLNQALPAMRAKADKANQLDANIATQAAAFKSQHPDADMAGLVSAARTRASYGNDDQGNPTVLKDLGTVDPNQPYLQQAFDANPENFFSPGAVANAWKSVTNKKDQKAVNALPEYDAKGNMTNTPFNGKIPAYASVVKDPTGKVQFDPTTGAPQIDVVGSHDYQLDGETYRDDQGKKVPVVDDNTFKNYYHGAIKADIEGKVKKILATPVNFDGSGPSNFSPDSDYADMLRKNLLYEGLKDNATKAASFTDVEGKSFERKNQLARLGIAQAGLDLSKQRLSLSKKALALRAAGKIGSGADLTDDFLGSVNDAYGQDLEVETAPASGSVSNWKVFSPSTWGNKDTPGAPAQYEVKRVIPVTADPRDLDIIAGKVGTDGKRPIAPQTFKVKDGETVKGWLYDPTTKTALGADKVEINPKTVQETFIKQIGGTTETRKIKDAGNRTTTKPATKTTKTTAAGLPILN